MAHRRNKAVLRKERLDRKAAGALPRYVDLVEWVRMRVNVTRATAARVIMAGALKADSHIVGVKSIPLKDREPLKLLDPIIDADLAKRIVIVEPEILKHDS